MNDMNKNDLKEKVVDYADKVFFYCVKRCNSRMDAEDLSQTILLEIIGNIDKGARIDNMDYYVWGVCKNQYNIYLRKTIKDRNNLELNDDIDKKDDSISALDEMLEDEKVRRMNQAIKLLSKDYTQILYAYYVEDKTLKFISEELNMPLGTVKKRLFTIRQKLKEYLDMEKLNGKKAYVPKDFSASFGMMKMGTYNPHNYVNTLINKNLLYHSYDNPCTIEDYSLELGISRPYVEDIVDQLVKVTLLKKVDSNRFITNFPYITTDILNSNANVLLDNYKVYTNELIKFVKKHIDEYKQLITYANLTNEEAMWSFCLYLNYEILNDVRPMFAYHDRPGGGKWDFYMTDLRDANEFLVDMGINTYQDGIDRVNAYTFQNASNVGRLAFNKSANGTENYELLNELLGWCNAPFENIINRVLIDNKDQINDYINKGFIKVVNNKIKFNFPFFTYHDFKKVTKLAQSSELDIVKEKLQIIIDKLSINMKGYLPKYLEDYSDSLLSNQLWDIQGLVVKAFNDAGLLDNKEKEDFFPYNLIMITSDINKIYEK